MFIPLDGHEPVSERRSRPPVRALRATGGRYAAEITADRPHLTVKLQKRRPEIPNKRDASVRTERH